MTPTAAQISAGNYVKDHLVIQGLPISIENRKGSIRRGKDKTGKPWQVVMPCAYGYFKRSEGADGEHIDVFVGPHWRSDKVFIIDQINADDKSFDEHKVMLGFGSKLQAINTYRKAFSDGKALDRIGAIHEMTTAEFKQWLRHEDTTTPLKEGGIVPELKPKKITRDAFLYMEPDEGDPRRKRFAQCGTCFLLTAGKCLVHGPNVKITPDMACGLYVPGEPQKHLAGQERPLVTPLESGLVRGQVRCENCQYTAGSDNGCGLYRMLNQRQEEDFDLDPKINSYGCCNAFTARRKPA